MKGYLEPEEYYEDATRADWYHVDDLPDYSKMRRNLNLILDVLYGEKEVEDIEFPLEKLCSALNVKLPSKVLKIEKQSLANRIDKIREAIQTIIEKDEALAKTGERK